MDVDEVVDVHHRGDAVPAYELCVDSVVDHDECPGSVLAVDGLCDKGCAHAAAFE